MWCVGGMVEETTREATGHEFESQHTHIAACTKGAWLMGSFAFEDPKLNECSQLNSKAS